MKTTIIIVIMMLLILSCGDRDWANLKKYKEDNKALHEPATNEKRVVFMGNSITEGWSVHDSIFFINKPYINRGISGQTTAQMLIRFKQDVISLKPTIVVILAGTNDIAENNGPITIEKIKDNIIAMITLAQKNHIKVILCSIHPAYDYPWRPGLKPNEKIPALNKLLKEYSDKNKIVYLDYFAAMNDGNNGLVPAYTYDGVHPNKKGYQVMAPLAEAAIKKILKMK